MAGKEREVDLLYRLSCLLAGGADGPSFLRAVLREALALTESQGGEVLLLERDRRMLCSFVREGAGGVEEKEVPAETSPWGDAIREGRVIHAPPPADTASWPGRPTGALLVIPLLARGDVLGVLTLRDPADATLASPQGPLLETLANLAAHALDTAALSRHLSRQKAERSTLIEVGQDIAGSLDLDEVLRRVVRQAARLLRGKVCSLMLVDELGKALVIRATFGASQTYTLRLPLDIAGSLIGEVVRTGTPMAVLDVREDSRYQFGEIARQEGLCSLLCVPLTTQTRVIGVLSVYTAERRRFREEEVEFLSALAAQSATAIENARLYRTMLDAQERLWQSERLAALGRTAAGLAHEIRNPLHTMQLLVYAMQTDILPPSPLHADLEVIQNEIARLTLLVDQFLDVARPKPCEVRPQKLQEIMQETLLLVGAEAKRRDIQLRKSWPRDLPLVWVDGAQIKQVFLNVLLNALQAMDRGGAIDLSIGVDGEAITTVIQDQGEGIPEELQAHLFTPFFTTKPRGSGLGLPIAQRIIEGHHGYIQVMSRPGVGTTVSIRLPLTVKDHEKDPACR